MLVKEIKWISKAALEASVLIKESDIEIWCFSQPFKLSIGESIDAELHGFCCTDIVKVKDELFKCIKTGELSYELTGMVLEKKERIFFLNGLEIELDIDFPGDVYVGDFIQFHCLRIDIW